MTETKKLTADQYMAIVRSLRKIRGELAGIETFDQEADAQLYEAVTALLNAGRRLQNIAIPE